MAFQSPFSKGLDLDPHIHPRSDTSSEFLCNLNCPKIHCWVLSQVQSKIAQETSKFFMHLSCVFNIYEKTLGKKFLNRSWSGRSPLVATQSSVKASGRLRGEEQEALKRDQVQQDKVWREFVKAERKATKYWYQNWSFLKDYDPLGKEKVPDRLPEYIPIFSDKIPNTTNHVIGSRMNTDLGKTLIKMDYFLNYGRRKKKLGQELQPS